MLRWTHAALATTAAAAGLDVVGAGDAAKQRAELRRLLHQHNDGVARNSRGPITVTNTYDTETALYFDHYRLAVLPSVSGGAVRQPLRTNLLESGAVAGVQTHLLAPWQAGDQRRVVVFGCRSVPYLRRQLRADGDHAYLVVDASLKDLAEAAAALVPEFGQRICFLRCESMFACVSVLAPETVDVALVPMPVPFWSKQGSHRRLVHFDFYCAVHRALRVREGPADPRGVVLFTDCEPYAAFMMEHLEEAKLLVPYTRKNPQDIFHRWLPLGGSSTDNSTNAHSSDSSDGTVKEKDTNVVTGESAPARQGREFPKQRGSDVVALAAAKSGPTTAEALQLLSTYSYARKYYRDFANEPAEEDETLTLRY